MFTFAKKPELAELDTLTTIVPEPLIEPPITLSLTLRVTLCDSPVTKDSLISLEPLMIIPSNGMLSPGLTKTIASFCTSLIETSFV